MSSTTRTVVETASARSRLYRVTPNEITPPGNRAVIEAKREFAEHYGVSFDTLTGRVVEEIDGEYFVIVVAI